MAKRVAAFIGHSGAGKTTLVASLIARYVEDGETVAAIKHTHHPLNEENRGDTARFRAAGAEPVILAGDREGVVFEAGGTRRIAFGEPADLLGELSANVVLVEGFKSFGGWPTVNVDAERRPTVEEVIEILDRIWAS
jgi:molybdopterin-guanine dinucleotide biosynthesis adapter protein